MGPLLALLTVLALNLAPADVATVTLSSYVVEGVGFSPEPAVFRLERLDGERWAMSNARGEPWFEVVVQASTIRLIGASADETLDLAEALGLPEAWWDDATVAPAGTDPLDVARVPNGIDVHWSGSLAGEIRW